MNSIDILAKLLASENISIIRSNSRTASFDIKNRVLVLPKWKEMSPQVEEMLILHEVGHALFTSMDEYIEKVKDNRTLANYANVIEDVRIERKMKERYPGSRKSFFIGYRELNSKDFFNVKSMNLKDAILIDRINLYYKVGYNCGVDFTAEERKFLVRIEKAETEQEVVALAREIYAFSKNELKEKMDAMSSANSDIFAQEDDDDDLNYDFGDDADGEYEDGSESEDDGDGAGDSLDEEKESDEESGNSNYRAGKRTDVNDVDEKDLESKTYEAMKNKLEDLSDDSVNIKYFVPEFWLTHNSDEVLIPYKRILKICQEYFSRPEMSAPRPAVSQSSNNMVSYLIKEFEMKKAATAYKYAKISKTGQLDLDKIYAYKLKDDLFKQITKTQDGKKHGMIFLLDWSGSMQNYLRETIDQVINLSMFCHRAQIPFQVLAFTDHFSHHFRPYGAVQESVVLNQSGIGVKSAVSLLELFSNKMTNLEFNQMIAYLTVKNIGYRHALPNCMELGGTPLNQSLVYLSSYIGKFMKLNGVEKMSLITLTDGEGGGIESNIYNGFSGRSWSSTLNKLVTNKSYLRDPITKKEYLLTNDSSTQTSSFLSLIRDRYECTVLGFYVVSNRRREIVRYCNNNMSSNYNHNTIMDIQVKLKSTGYCIQNNISGRDEFYLLDSNKMNVEEGSMDSLDSSSNSRQIAKTFSKMMNVKKTSRVVLNSFIAQVA